MNGDSYSSRGMASTNAIPRIRKHETDSSHATADAGRYGSSRDYYVSTEYISLYQQCRHTVTSSSGRNSEHLLIILFRVPETTVEIENLEIVITGAQIGEGLGHRTIEVQDRPAANPR